MKDDPKGQPGPSGDGENTPPPPEEDSIFPMPELDTELREGLDEEGDD